MYVMPKASLLATIMKEARKRGAVAAYDHDKVTMHHCATLCHGKFFGEGRRDKETGFWIFTLSKQEKERQHVLNAGQRTPQRRLRRDKPQRS